MQHNSMYYDNTLKKTESMSQLKCVSWNKGKANLKS